MSQVEWSLAVGKLPQSSHKYITASIDELFHVNKSRHRICVGNFSTICGMAFLVRVREQVYPRFGMDSTIRPIPWRFNKLGGMSIDNLDSFRIVQTDLIGGNSNNGS